MNKRAFGLLLFWLTVFPSTASAQFVFGLDHVSPSLTVGPYLDADVLSRGTTTPVLHMNAPTSTTEINAFSGNSLPPLGNFIRLAFSVDRFTQGTAGSDVFGQFVLNQQSGDVFGSELAFPDPLSIPLPPGIGYLGPITSAPQAGNQLLIDESTLTLTATGTPGELTPPNVLVTPGPDPPDQLDSLNFRPFDVSGDMLADRTFYYSVTPQQATLNTLYQSAADIYFITEDSLPQSFAPAIDLGLDALGPNTDDVDGLVVFDVGTEGLLEPGLDLALFSLGPGSASLETFGLSAGDVFLTDLQGRFFTFATACNLGLDATCDLSGTLTTADALQGPPAPPANVTALAYALLGDMNWDQQIRRDDVPAFVDGLVDPLEYFFTYGGPPTAAGDMDGDRYHDYDDIPPFADVVEFYAPQPASVPEGQPSTVLLAWLAFLKLRKCRTSRWWCL